MRGIISYGGYVPYHRLDLTSIGAMFSGGGRGTRSVASYDEDTTTMGVEAARLALASARGDIAIDDLWFSTTSPAYADKTNATTVHAALQLPSSVVAADMVGAVRSASGALLGALRGPRTAMVVCSDTRGGLPGGPDEAAGGDGASCLIVGDDSAGPVAAEFLGAGSATAEFVDRWRVPGEARSRMWEDRFGEVQYVPLAEEAWAAALADAGVTAAKVKKLFVAGLHARAVKRAAGRIAGDKTHVVDGFTGVVGNTGAAQATLGLAAMLEEAKTGEIIAVATLADGVDVMIFKVTKENRKLKTARPVADQLVGGGPVGYGKFLSWRGMVEVEPPRRPSPDRPSSSAAARVQDWKYGFVGSVDRDSGAVHMPPARVSYKGGAVDDMEQRPMAAAHGTVVTYTVDRMMYSPSPPTIFAVVDFDGGGRMPVELTDVEPEEVEVGTRLEMTFRRLFTSDGIHNYFWKAAPIRPSAAG